MKYMTEEEWAIVEMLPILLPGEKLVYGRQGPNRNVSKDILKVAWQLYLEGKIILTQSVDKKPGETERIFSYIATGATPPYKPNHTNCVTRTTRFMKAKPSRSPY